MKDKKKILWISLGTLDVLITGFLFVIHIIMLTNVMGRSAAEVQAYAQNGKGLIPYLIGHLTLYLWLFVIPLFVILAANIIILVMYVKKKAGKPEQVKVSDLSDEEKEKLKAELLKDLNK